MTKQLRKGLMTVLLFVMAIVCAFSASTLFTARADAKADAFVANATAFVEAADANDDGVLANDEIRAVMGTDVDTKFYAMYNFINNDAIGDLSSVPGYTDAKANYDQILAQYNVNGAVDLYSKLVTRAYTIHATNQASYTNNDEVVAMRTAFTTIYNSADTKDLAFLHNSDLVWVTGEVEVAGVMQAAEIPEDLAKAETKMNGFKVAIKNAISAVKKIKIFDATVDATQMITVWDDSIVPAAYRTFAEDNVVIDSKATITAARTAVNKVISNKDVAFIDGTKTFDGVKLDSVTILTNAESYLALQEAKITAVEKEINDLYKDEFSVVAGAEVVYTIGSKIENAETNYNALSTATFNNLKAEVYATVVTKLDEMTAAYSAIKNEIITVEGKITDIGTVVYTKDSKKLINETRAAFNALDNDVKVNDNKKYDKEDATMTYAVDNYADLKAAEAKWAELVDQIDKLVAAINALRGIETSEPQNIYSAFNRVQNGDSNVDTFLVGYNQLSDKDHQLDGGATGDNLAGVNAAAVTAFTPEGYSAAIANAKDAYAYYRNLANAITTATKPIIENIDELNSLYAGEVRFTSAFDALYKEIVDAISSSPVTGSDGKIDPRYKGAITNFDKYEALKAKYEELLTLADAWVVAVKKIGTVCTDKFDEVAAAVTAYETDLRAKYPVDSAVPATWTLDSDIAAFNRVYSTETTTYASYYTTYTNALTAKATIVAALDKVKGLANKLVRPDLGGDYDAYATDVANVTTKYNALPNPCGTPGETQKYFQENADYSAAYTKYATALVEVEANAIEAKIAKIVDLKDDNDNYIAKAREAYDGASDAAKVDGVIRNYSVLTDAETAIQTWINKVNALLTGAGFAGADILAKDVNASVVISKNNVIVGFYKLDVRKATGYEAKWSNNELSNVAKAYETTDYDAKDAYDLVCAMLRIAGTDTTGLSTKLTYIDTMLKDFVDSYNANTTPQVNYDTLYGWVEALTDSQRALIKTNVGAFKQIASDKAMADELANAIETLYNSKEITSDSVVQYYIIKTIYEGLNGSQKALVVIDVENGNVEKAFETIATNLDPVDYDFATIIGRIAALEERYTDAEVDGAITTAIASALTKDDGVIKLALAQVLTDAKAYVNEEIAKLSQDGGAIKVNAEAISAAVGRIQSLESAVNALDNTYATDAQLSSAIAALSGADGAITKAKEAAIEKAKELVKELNDKLYDATEGDIVKIKADIVKIKADIVDIIEKMATDEELTNAVKELEGKISAVEEAYKAADAQLKKDLQNSVAELKKSITIVTVILGIISAALAGCVVFIFIKKK